ARVDVRHVDLDHRQPAALDRVAQGVRGVRKRAGVGDDDMEPLCRGAVQPPDQLALVVGLTPRELVAEPSAAFGYLVHDLLERLRAVSFRLPAPEGPEVRAEQEQDPHHQPPIACAPEPDSSSAARNSSCGTASSTNGRPTSSNSTKRAPPRYLLYILMDETI